MRKKLLITVGAALTAFLLTVSCSNDFIEQNNPGTQTEGPRTIAVSFGPQTRTALDRDGVTPKFTGKDEWIKVSNGKESKDCKVTVDDKGNASFTTDLTGTLTAVYPESAAKMNGNAIAGVNVSYVQDGTFANANICMAKNITGNVAIFQNQTAVLCITPLAGDDTQYIEVSAEEYDISNYAPHGSTFTSHTVHVKIPETEKPIAYFVSILAPDGLTVGDLTFSDGVNEMTITGEKAATLIQAGTLCNVPAECWESPAPAADYVEIGGVKWATKNLGADKETDSGYYYSWGNTDGYVYDSAISKWVKASDHSVVLENGFSQDVYLETPGGKLTGEISSANDAATAYLGSGWRMPTSTEFQKLYDACYTGSYDTATNPAGASVSVGKGIYWCTGYDGAKGVLFVDESRHKLFFPAASFVNNTTLSTNNGYYWSSTYGSPFPYNLLFNNSKVVPQSSAMLRSNGCPIRPVYDPAPAPEKPTSLSGVFTVGEGKAVRFSRGNLYWDGTSSPGAYKFETEQYNYRLYPGKKNDFAFLDKSTVTPENTVGTFWWVKNDETAGTPYSPEYNIEITSCSENDILFTNETAITPNTDFTVNGDKGVWRALSGGSGGEWEYLLDKRTGAANKVGCATVNGVTGVIILPDTFDNPVDTFSPLDRDNPQNMEFTDNIYEIDSWKKLESAGAVFLPAVGHLGKSGVVDKNQIKCHYWSSSSKTNITAYSIMIDLIEEVTSAYDGKSFNSSGETPRTTISLPVRLVTDAPVAGSTVEDLKVWEDDKSNWE